MKDAFGMPRNTDMLVQWGSLIKGCIKLEEWQHALVLYQKMREDALYPDAHTYVALLKACTQLKDIERGCQLHAEISITNLLERDAFISSTLVDMYAKCRAMDKAQEVFDQLPSKSTISCTSLIAGYVKEGNAEEALSVFDKVQLEGGSPDNAMYICSLKACCSITSVQKGQHIHAEIVRKGCEVDDLVSSSLVDMYASCGLLIEAEDVFDKLSVHDVVSWTTLMVGYTKYDCGHKALECFEMMQLEDVPPNTVTFVSILKACGKTGMSDKGQEVHAEILKLGLLSAHPAIGNVLVDMYAKCGLLEDAQVALYQLPTRDVVSWNTIMAGYAKFEQFEEVLSCYRGLLLDGKSPNNVSLTCTLNACSGLGFLDMGLEVHAEANKQGSGSDLLVGSALLDMYVSCGVLIKALEIFNELPVRDVVAYTTLIAGYIKQGLSAESLQMLQEMESLGVNPNLVTYVYGLRACSCVGAGEKGKHLHAAMVKKGFLEGDLVIDNALVDMYSQCGLLFTAREVFDRLLFRDTVSWNALMAGYINKGHGEEALDCYESMHIEGVSPDVSTYIWSLKACIRICSTLKGDEIHAEVARRGFLNGDFTLANSLVDMYAACGSVSKALDVFEVFPQKGLTSWNALIAAYVENDFNEEALFYFEEMQREDIVADGTTYFCILKAFSSSGAIEKVVHSHAEIARRGLLDGENVVLGNALINAYMKHNLFTKANEVLDGLSFRDVIVWNSLIAGYALKERGEEALRCFGQMQSEGVHPNSITIISLLKACSTLGAADKGCEIHHAIISQSRLLNADVAVGNALVDMYAKVGLLSQAQEVFDRLCNQGVVSWTALITGYAHLGDCKNVFSFFNQMIGKGKTPNLVTISSMLHACCHSGHVDEGESFFLAMVNLYEIIPSVEQCTCMLDLLSRAGQLQRSMVLIDAMPFHPDRVAWNTMMGACRKWGDAELGRWAFEHAVYLDCRDEQPFMCMRNIYSNSDVAEDIGCDGLEYMCCSLSQNFS